MSDIGVLRDIGEKDLDLMRVWRNAPAVRANMYTQHEISPEEHLAWWEKTKNRTDQKYLMYEMAGIPIGITAFTSIDTKNKNSAWAFYTSPSAPKGSGSKMEYLMLEYAFNLLNLHKLYCEVLAFNESVIKLHQKFGFQIEGIFRDQYQNNDQYVNIYRLAILATEWECKRQEMQIKITGKTKQ